MDNWMIGLAILVAFSLIAKAINYKATKKLDHDKKAELPDLFNGTYFYNTVIWIGLTILFFISIRFQLIDKLTTYIIYIISFLGFIAIIDYISFKKLQRNNFQESYIKSYIISKSLGFLGILLFLTISY